MAPPESEWMLWAKRIQMSIRAELDKELQTLPNRYAVIAPDRARLDSLQDQVKDLTTSHDHAHLSNQTLRDRVEELEAEHSILHRKAATESNTRQETTANLAKQLEDVAATFARFKRDSWATEEEKRRELQGLKKQIEGLTGKKEPGREEVILTEFSPVSKTFSEATTADECTDVTTNAPKNIPPPQQQDWSIAQGRATYAEYLASGEKFIREVLEQSEVQAVKAYINGMKQPFRQRAVVEALEINGWTWQNARHELQKIVDEGKRRRQSRRSIKLPS
ncbi:MAG: hypothetical protein LQ352_000297 [Teloschistes flavicans]|nr:MAG: hypothetical protein LQ352_000297 [Teloschistes flavicans]